MKIRKLLGSILACAVITASNFTFTAAAAVDKSKLSTDKDSPALSFDSEEWKDYVKLTSEADKANLALSTEKTKTFQAYSLKISGELKSNITHDMTYAKYLTDKKGNKLYPKAGSNGERAWTIGAEISAKDFGLDSFDGCSVSFTYRFGEDVGDKLFEKSMFVYPTNDFSYQVIEETPLQIKYDDSSDDNNVDQYANGTLNVRKNIKSTKIVFEVPLIKTTAKTALVYLDNITIKTTEKDGSKALYAKNVDGYNSSADKAKISSKVIENEVQTMDIDTSNKSESSGKGLIIVFVIIGIVVVAAIVIFIIKLKQRFY